MRNEGESKQEEKTAEQERGPVRAKRERGSDNMTEEKQDRKTLETLKAKGQA